MAIRNIFLVAHTWLLCAVTLLVAGISAPSFAGTQIAGSRQQVCNVIIEYPSRMEFGLENATCDQNGNLVGQHSISITVDLAIRNGVRFTFDSNFLNGRLNGLTSIQTDVGFSFDGEIFPNGRTVGRTVSFDGSVVEGETRGGVANLTGTVTRRNGQVIYYINGRESEASAFADNQSPNPSSGKGGSLTTPPTAVADMSNVTVGKVTCLVDLPVSIYVVKSKLSGKCVNGYYSGPAKLTLTPKADSQYQPMTASLVYQNGQIASAVELKYPALNMLYSGDILDWLPYSGNAVQDIGNDNYLILQLENGREIYRNTEYRQPKASTLALRKLVSNLVTTVSTNAVDCVIGSCAKERRDRKAQERQTAIYEQQQAQIREQQRQNDVAKQAENDRYKAEQANIRSQQLAAIEDARIKQLAGLDRDGNPIVQPAVPVVIARNDPPPVFVVDTRPPAPTVTTNPQVDPPAITTTPPELALPTAGNNAPPPLPSGQPIPEQSPSPLAPPVQLGSGGDTLETGQPVPSYPVPQPVPVYEPTLPTPPVIDVAGRPTPTPVNNTVVNQNTTPSVPFGLAPSGSSSTPAIVTNPVILRWSAITGADNYDFGISSEASGYRLVVDQRLRDTFYSGNLSPGKYRWNLRACNSRGECSVFTAQEYFEILGAANAQSATVQSALSPPTQLYPTNQGELAFPVPIEWNRVAGATSYKVAVRDVTENVIIENDTVTTSNTLIPRNQKAGHYYEWDVQACNAVGCSVRSRNAGFRTVAAVQRTLTYDDVISPRERAIFDEHFAYLARIPESNPPAKFTPEHIKRMQDGGRWGGYITGIEADNRVLRNIENSRTDYCGSGPTAFVPDRILNTDISSACKTHDACYASSSSQLTCDLGIMRDIFTICRQNKSSPTCYYAAYKYYDVLHTLGFVAYAIAQKKRR